MALSFTGGLIVRAFKPKLVNPCLVVPGSLNLQVRNAARKGYRSAAERKKKIRKLEKAAVPKETTFKQRGPKMQATVPTGKPLPPNDDIIILNNFDHKRYSIQEAVKFHKEYHHPTVYNNPNSYVSVKLEFNMIGKKSTQFIKPFSGVAPCPHQFSTKRKREVLVFCDTEHVEPALEAGASVAGGAELIKKIQGGMVQPSYYDYIICHINFLEELSPIRGLLKDKTPRLKYGTATHDVKSAVLKFLHGIEYECMLLGSQDLGGAICDVGTIEMNPEEVEANFISLLESLMEFKPEREGEFIKYAWCLSPPSNEEFLIDLEYYLKEVELLKSEEKEDLKDSDEQKLQLLQYQLKKNTVRK